MQRGRLDVGMFLETDQSEDIVEADEQNQYRQYLAHL